MSNKRKLILASLILCIGLIFWGYLYTFHSEHRNISEEKAVAEFNAFELLNKFKQSNTNLHSSANQVIMVVGSVTTIEQNIIVLNDIVQINLLEDIDTSILHGTSITIKGRCVGYDELLEVVKIDQAIIITK